MALIKCSECGNEISTQAKSCPKCGAKPKRSVGLVGKVVGVLILVVIINASLRTGSDEAVAARQAASATPTQPRARVSDETMREATTALEANIAAAAAAEKSERKR